MLPPDGAEYPLILRGETYQWWRSLLGAVFGLSLFLLLTAVVSQALVTLFWATTANDQMYRDYFTDAFAFRTPTRHAGGQPWHRHADPDRLGSVDGGASGPSAVAVLGRSRDPLAATCSAVW